MEVPQIVVKDGVPPLLANLYRWKGENFGPKTYGIKARFCWERPWGTHWEPREHIENLMGTKEKCKKSSPFGPPI
jgi:hypothetical protein